MIIWAGQLVSLLGSGMTRFALGVWLYERTGQTTDLALIAFFPELAILALAPLAGALVDRWDRRRTMLISDGCAGLITLAIATLLLTERLEIWHLYIAATASAACTTFQLPAYAAATAQLVPQEQLGRASGLIQLGQAVGQLLAPVLAGLLVTLIDLQGIILIDVITFLLAVATLALVRLPRLPGATAERAPGSLLREATFGWRYITARSGLLAMLALVAAINFTLGIAQIVLTPLVLSFASAATLGTILSIGGSGMLVGSIVMSVWGGPQRRMLGVLGFAALQGIGLALVGLRPSVVLLTAGTFLVLCCFPLVVGCAEAIWLSKVPLEVQGRVFATRNMLAGAALPLAYLLAGPLADRLFTPLLLPGGALAASLGPLIGVGGGRGIGLLLIVLGGFALLAALVGWRYPRLRLLETELADRADAPATMEAGTVAEAASQS